MSYLKTAEGGARRPAPDMLSSTEEFPPLGGGKTSAPTTPVTAASHLGHSQQQQQPQQTQQQVAGQLANDIDGSQDLGMSIKDMSKQNTLKLGEIFSF